MKPLLKDADANVVNTANNHALDHGKEAFEKSLGLLEDHGVHVIGYRNDSYFQEEPLVLDPAGIRVGFLGYNISNFADEDERKCVERTIIGDGNRIFAPNLGNFIFDQKIEKNRITAVLRTEIREGTISFE